MAHAVKITQDEVESLLRPDRGWNSVKPADALWKERVYDWPVATNVADKKGNASTVFVRVFSSIDENTGVSRSVGSDAIRVCAVRIWPNSFNVGFITSIRVYRVEGWRVNLINAVRKVMEQVKTRIEQMPKVTKQTPVAKQTDGAMLTLVEMLKQAAEHVSKPALYVPVGDTTLKITRAPKSGKNPGYAYVIDHGSDAYLGKIAPDGNFWPVTAGKAYVEALVEIAKDPKKHLAKAGMVSGHCHFCNRKLTTEASTSVGYGPVCASHWNLPWGNNPAAKANELEGATR